MSTSTWREMLRRGEAVLIFLISFALAAVVLARRHDVEIVLGAIGPWAKPLAVLIFAIVASAPFSVTDALAIMNGALFGPLWGSIVNALGLVLAATIGYVVALRTSRLLDIEKQLNHLPAWARRFKPGSPMFLITVRIIPGLGGTIATQTAAALRVPLFRQIYTMCVVAVPICTFLAIVGEAGANYWEARVMVPAQAYADRHHLPIHFKRRHHEASPTPHPTE